MPNRLAEEKSPYLLQHKDNPVDWYPWSNEAFEKAAQEDKPVFVSIGYSTCHWCHVMEEESFEDEEIAGLLNDNFVSVKVDREERPDIDGIYMSVCQLMTGSGGWPLTVILTPDKKPFFSGTYFPKESKYGRAGLNQILSRVTELWNDKRSELLSSADKITESLHEISDSEGDQEIIPELIDSGYHQLKRNFDKLKGGFGPAPKFPSPHNLLFLMRYWRQSRQEDALEMTVKTLLEMRRGGIYDHIGYGFHRYSTDKNWLLPHFEKMLYDQAMLMLAFTEAYQITKHRVFKETVYEIADYVKRNLTSPEGAFYSAEDADSEGIEGRFYLWSYEELQEALGEDLDLTVKLYNIKKEGNYVDPAEGGVTGKNILYTSEEAAKLLKEFNMNEENLKEKISRINKRLFEKREKRVHPHLDDKVLTDWNGLMIAALAKAGSVFNDNTFSDMAEGAASFIIEKLYERDSGLLHRYRDGEAAIPGTLDDYAFMVWGLTELYQSVFNIDYLRKAVELNNYMISHFYDSNKSGFYIAPDNAADEIVRQKTAYDGAVPSGNSVAVYNLVRLASFTGSTDYRDLAGKTADHFASAVQELPSAYSFLISAVSFLFSPLSEVVITGSENDEDVKRMLEGLRNNYLPETVTILKDADNEEEIGKLAPFTRLHNRLNDKAAAYVCKNQNCRLPVTDSTAMIDLINQE